MSKLKLSVVSQEEELLSLEVDSVTAPTTSGEITVLPHHIPLLTELQTGELVYTQQKKQHSIVISKGFLDKDAHNNIIVMVDQAVHARDISPERAQQAKQQAEQTIATSTNQRELLLAEASLKQALWEIRVAQKTKKTKI